MFANNDPLRVDPVMNSIDDVIVCTTNVVAVIVPVDVIEPDTFNEPVTVALPEISNVAFNAVYLPIPTLDCDTNSAFEPNCPIRAVLSENASIMGIPEISLTENSEPESESVIENN